VRQWARAFLTTYSPRLRVAPKELIEMEPQQLAAPGPAPRPPLPRSCGCGSGLCGAALDLTGLVKPTMAALRRGGGGRWR